MNHPEGENPSSEVNFFWSIHLVEGDGIQVEHLTFQESGVKFKDTSRIDSRVKYRPGETTSIPWTQIIQVTRRHISRLEDPTD